MKQVLFVRPDTREDGNIMWCESGSDQVETRQTLSALADHALAARVCLLLPASEMIFRHFTLPKKGGAGQGMQFSWLAEETLIGEVDNLHWTVLNKKGRDVDAVAMDIDRLQHWLTRCAEAGLTVVQVLPDAILLPVAEGGSTLVAMDDGYWMRYSPFGACETDDALLPLLLSQQGAGEIVCYGEAPADVQVEPLPWQHPLVLIQPQWKNCKANLLHGDFAPAAATGGFRHAKAAMAVVAVLGLGLMIGPRVGMALMLTQQENLAHQQMTELAQHYFPTLRQTTNLKYHFGQSIKKEKKGVFLQLEALEQIKQTLPSVELSEVGYDETQNLLTLNISSMDATALQAFVNKASDTFDFTLQPVSGEAPFTAIITGKYK
ncbi:type II secretion system protein GspL [Enterobacter asburiae]|uniref:type II secretion system protein GspL n=1 Tax=Enterobacter genomosp. O TaxID=2364150 RepID=UPI0006432935|nr:type II secretion system protein GspL [Enterobacter genomosp. O]EKI0253613.1 type II secretion system protein GspL [Enterobacter asburiae]KLP55393.1 general secretion pathway protein GspL [Enterobacter genomosp. O]